MCGRGKHLNSGTNNDAEMLAALDGLQYVSSTCTNKRIVHLTDSKLVEGGITGNTKLNATRHQNIRASILDLQGKHGNYIISYQIPREANSGADRMCNLSMDSLLPSHQFDVSPSDILEDQRKTKEHVATFLDSSLVHYGEATLMTHQYKLKWVLTELTFKNSCQRDISYHTPGGPKVTKEVYGDQKNTGFETNITPNIIEGTERVIPINAFNKLKLECDKNGIIWHEKAFAKCEYGETCPSKDIALLSALCRAVGNDVALIIKWYRDQTEADNIPNKHLRPLLYEKYLKHYSGLSDLCKIARHGFKSRVTNFHPPRPFTSNHQSALERSPAVQKKLVKEAMLGRTLILEHDTAILDSRVNTCLYAVAPKNNIDYATDGRLIHDGSYPHGTSVNDAVPDEKLDASTDDVKDIARRILSLYDQFPQSTIFGMAADVDSAFQNAHAHEMSALLFGGSVPGAPFVAIALTAIFGYRDSPAIFALFAKGAQHFHQSGSSELLSVPTPFWNWVWVDDFVCIEPDIGSRLSLSEHQLRSAFHLVFGSPGWNNAKYAPWSNHLHAVGLDWNLSNGTVSMPTEKINKALLKVQECIDMILKKNTPSVKIWRSLVGTLRHVGLCVPAAKPFYQSFVSTEKILLAHGSPQWNDLAWDLSWFRSILTTNNLNGVSMERFTKYSDRTILLYLGWSPTHTFLMDFHMNKAIIIEDCDASLGGMLLEYHVCTEILTPFAFGPFHRTDLQINIKCQTAGASRRIRNWQFQKSSLRQLGWLCSQQHVHIVPSGPRINENISLSSYTNFFLQELQEQASPALIRPMELPFVHELMNYNTPVLDLEPVPPTVVSSKLGQNSVISIALSETPSISCTRANRMKFYECSLQLVVWDMDPESPSVLKHFATCACPLSRASTKSNFTSKSQLDCAWEWVWKGIRDSTPLTHCKGSHLAPSSCIFLVSNSWPKVAQHPSLNGDALSWGSSPSVGLVKCGVPSSKKIPIILSSGTTLPMAMEQSVNVNRTPLPNGLISSLRRPRVTDTRKELQFDLEKSTIRCYVPSKAYGGLLKEETLSKSGIVPVAEFLKSEKEWSCIGRPLSITSSASRRRLEWTLPVCLDTRSESVEQPNLWPQDSAERSLNLWDVGTPIATWPIYV